MAGVWTDAEARANGLIECETNGACAVCGVNATRWRAVVLDFHLCSKACLEEARELLDHSKPLAQTLGSGERSD